VKLSQFDVPLAEEVAVGGAVGVNWVSKGGGLVLGGGKDQLALYLNRVGRNLAMQSSRPGLDWTFGVLESSGFNAVSAPGGYVLVTRGLLREVENEAQLAGVLAHEIAHITEKHAISAYRKVKTDACVAAFGGMVFGEATENLRKAFSAALAGASQALDLDAPGNFDVLFAFTDGLTKALEDQGFELEQEHQADQLGLALVINAGYSPYEYVRFLDKIPEGGTAFPHHPSNADRRERLNAYIRTLREEPDFYPDYPFKDYPVVPLKNELAQAR
jgi:predicted Zn-dependent protease